MKALRRLNFVLAGLAVLPPMAHVLELPNKLSLGGPLWLAVQQHLYRGWGPFFGAPVEIGALLTSAALLIRCRHDPALRRLALIACIAYTGMLAAFFIFNQPVNQILADWTGASPPPEWVSLRWHWETGHTLAAILALLGLAASARGWLIAHDRRVLRSHHGETP